MEDRHNTSTDTEIRQLDNVYIFLEAITVISTLAAVIWIVYWFFINGYHLSH